MGYKEAIQMQLSLLLYIRYTTNILFLRRDQYNYIHDEIVWSSAYDIIIKSSEEEIDRDIQQYLLQKKLCDWFLNIN